MGAAIAAAIALAGSYYNSQQQADQNSKNIDEQRRNNSTALASSNTAHVREVNDLKAAGLNPILSAGGQGSSTPSLSSQPQQAPQVSFPDIMQYGLSIRQIEQRDKELELADQGMRNQTLKTASDIDVNKATSNLSKINAENQKYESQGFKLKSRKDKYINDILDSTDKMKLKNMVPKINTGGPMAFPRG